MSEVVLETRDLTKRYDSFVAVDQLNLTIRRGEVFGLLGPNGAGKTTTILMLLGLTEPSAGDVEVLGLDPRRQPLKVKAHVGYLPDQIGFYDDMTARENLIYIAKLNGLSRAEGHARADEALQRMGLAAVANKRVATFSRGMRQRLGVGEILLKRPQLIIMDEPTLGLDPEAAREFLELIRDLKADGITIMLSSHLLHQVQAVCDRVGLFYQGRMVLEGTVEALAERVLGAGYRIRLEAEQAGDLGETLAALPEIVAVRQREPALFELETTSDVRSEVARSVVDGGGRLLSLTMAPPSLDEIYTRYFQEVHHASAA